MADRTNTDPARMEKIVSLCKRRGFIFQSAEIYGGLNGCWDYGPMGVELKRNLKEYWWRKNVQEREDVVGMDGSILTHNSVLVASGHVGGFSDPMCDCLLTKERLRADQVPAQSGMGFFYTGAAKKDGSWNIEKKYSVLVESEKQADKARKTAAQYYAQLAGKDASYKDMELKGECMETVTDSTMYNPANGSLLTEAREFNLMFKTTIGATSDENDPNATGWLRPETAQSIFCQYKNILDSSRVKLPFGIAQIGKSFRNEINPRNFTFRSREFEQMEIEYFCRPEDGLRLVDEWLEHRLCFYDEVGVPREHIHILDVPDGERAFYSKKTYDLEYEFPFGIQELEGIAYRTDYDLTQHQNHSGKSMEYMDPFTNARYIPYCIEPSVGAGRMALAFLCDCYDEETLENGDVRNVLHLHPALAPYKAAVLPLQKKLGDKAKELYAMLSKHFMVDYDETGAIGKRYRRQDEIGTPLCITVDFETVEGDPANDMQKDTVTVRDRDTMQQIRLPIDQLVPYIEKKIEF